MGSPFTSGPNPGEPGRIGTALGLAASANQRRGELVHNPLRRVEIGFDSRSTHGFYPLLVILAIVWSSTKDANDRSEQRGEQVSQ